MWLDYWPMQLFIYVLLENNALFWKEPAIHNVSNWPNIADSKYTFSIDFSRWIISSVSNDFFCDCWTSSYGPFAKWILYIYDGTYPTTYYVVDAVMLHWINHRFNREENSICCPFWLFNTSKKECAPNVPILSHFVAQNGWLFKTPGCNSLTEKKVDPFDWGRVGLFCTHSWLLADDHEERALELSEMANTNLSLLLFLSPIVAKVIIDHKITSRG